MNTGRTPQDTPIKEYLSERQEALHAFNHLKEHFGLAWTDLRKTMALFVITIRKGAELSALEARRSRILKKLKREEQGIRAKYQKETAKALGLAPAKRSTAQKITEFALVVIFSLLLFALASSYAYAERGYKAIGREHLLLFTPLYYYLVKSTVKDMKQIFSEIKEEEKQDKNKGAS